MLKKVLIEDPSKGLSIKAKHLIPHRKSSKKQIPLLKNYSVDNSIQKTIQHNLRWTNGEETKPKFKFIYLALPTDCNQKCMGCFTGKDKERLPSELNGKMYSHKTIENIIGFAKDHNVEAIVYPGGGELFTWNGAFDYINQITDSGLGMMIFTNGTLLSHKNIQEINKKDISLTISLRDTNEKDHNCKVGIKGFRKTLQTLEYALQEGMHKENRLAVEIPTTKYNEERVLYDFLPAMRSLNIIPFGEEYIQTRTSEEEKELCHNFSQTRSFFAKASSIDRKFGYIHKPKFGQRMFAQPKCERTLYSFIIYPSGDVMACPSDFTNYGNFYETSLKNVIYSEKFKSALKIFQLCPCSTFYTRKNKEIPNKLPKHLEGLK